MSHSIYIYLAVMIGVTYLLRVLPMTLIRRPIQNTFVRSFLYYVPYVTLSVMTFPAILDVTGSPAIGLAAFVIGIVMAWLGAGLLPVAAACCAVVLVMGLI